MNQYNEISTLQYMGSKARIISHICDPRKGRTDNRKRRPTESEI